LQGRANGRHQRFAERGTSAANLLDAVVGLVTLICMTLTCQAVAVHTRLIDKPLRRQNVNLERRSLLPRACCLQKVQSTPSRFIETEESNEANETFAAR
jgi:hypothetical protein